jgi:glycosyltransferase involved in cell wall biosynthesis
MRVLYLNPFSQEVSGPDESLRTLLARLVPLGVEAHVALPVPGPQVPRYVSVGATVHFLPMAVLRRDVSLSTAGLPVRVARGSLSVARLARRLSVDLIHTNMEVVLDGGLAARALGVPHVLHYRGNTLDRPKLVFDGLVAAWTRTSDAIFCISEATAGVFRRRGVGAKAEVMYNPVDLEAFKAARRLDSVRNQLGAAPDHRLIGTVGRIHPRKDLETFIRAAAQVSGRLPDLRFAIIGEATGVQEETYLRSLHDLARDVGLRDKLVFAGARRDIPDVMAALDFFVLTSRHEGFGRVVAEAMAASRPMVVTDEGAPPELVGHGRFGLTAPAADHAAFADRILELASDRERSASLAAGAAAAASQFDPGTIARRVFDRYDWVLRARANRRISAGP